MSNEKVEVRLSSPERDFTECYHDFMDCDWLSGEEKIIFLSLKRFLDEKSNDGKVYPTIATIQKMTGWGNQKVIKYIKSLVKKGVIKSIRQGLGKPNIYILSDYPEMWACDSIEEMATITDSKDKELSAKEHIAALKKMGYKVKLKEKALASEGNQTSDES